ncbi:putative Monooxygenase [Pseudohyphozyma bogoriensis]|nr:putative Monooxygenase [Pseudohyphozyma bogoriensis]
MEKAPLASSLRVIIIGGGTGGMSTALALAQRGIKSTVYETASKLGINLCPNLARVLDRLGVLDAAKTEAVPLDGAVIIRSKTDEVLSTVDFEDIQKNYGNPFYTIHRAALQRAIVGGCVSSGLVDLQLGKSIADVDFDHTRVRVRAAKDPEDQGEWVSADVIFAADGVKSFTRGAMLKKHGEDDDVVDTGQAAYRIMLTRDQILESGDEELLKLIDGKISHRWIGEKRHIIAYPIANNTIFNMSTAHPDTHFSEGPSSAYTTRGSKSEMLETYADFCPRVKNLLNLVPEGEVCEWKLRVHHPLNTWVDSNIALLGDACHPTLPHLAQGAAQAVEDAAVIGYIFGKLTNLEDIHKSLLVYQHARKARAELAVATAAANGRELHHADGDAQKDRDERFKASANGGSNPDKAVDKGTQKWLYEHDCVKDVEERWDELWAQAGGAKLNGH